MLDAAAKLLAEARLFITDVGLGNTVLLLVVLAIFFLGWTVYRDYRKRQNESAVIQAKEDEIVRLAADNRVWRDYFFRKMGGLALADIEQLGHSSPATPIEPKVSGSRKKKKGGS